MTSDRDLAADLAEEIRAAVGQTSHPRRAPDIPAAHGGDRAAAALERAQTHTTPSVPESARFSLAKRIALRFLRFVWREQASFNTDSLEASRALASGLTNQENLLDRMRQDLAAFEREVALMASTLTEANRARAIQDARLNLLEASSPGQGDTPQPAAASTHSAPGIPAGVYSLFEERFRGAPEEIAFKQRQYIEILGGRPGPVLDVGCGRGEFLRLLAERGIPASGVEVNPIAVAACRAAGLDVAQGDAVSLLSARPAGSLGAIVALQVVEHWTSETTFAFLREARRVLAPGGVLIAETINVESLSAWRAFFLDPSHVRPVPPEALRFLGDAAGFVDTAIEFYNPLPPGDRLVEHSENDAKLNRLLFGPQDYALIAYVGSRD